MNFRPLHDRIAIRPTAQEETSAGGIIIPETAKEKPVKGQVVAVGKGLRDDKGVVQALDVQVGNQVLYSTWAGTEIKINDEKLIIMKESDILGILN